MQTGDTLFFGLGDKESVGKVLNKLRLHFRDIYNLADDHHLAFCWILDFPLYEMNEETEKLDFAHNPFSNIT